MKRMIALLLALMMVFALAACGNSNTPGTPDAPATNSPAAPGTTEPGPAQALTFENYAYDRSWPEETVKIAVALFDPADESFIAVQQYFEYLTQYFNIKFVYSEAISSPEQELAFIDNCAAAGCKGYVAYYNISGTEAIKAVMNHGMYYCQTAEYYDQLDDTAYIAGAYTFQDPTDPNAKNGDYLAGYELAYALAEQGRKHVVFCSGGAAFGVQMFIDRQAGFFDGIAAAQADGYDIAFDPESDVIAGWPGTEDFTASQASAIAGDYDAVASAFDVAMWFQPVLESGEDIKLAAVGTVSEAYKTFMEMGVVTGLVYECPEFMWGSGIMMLLNSITGHNDLCQNADGSPRLQQVNRWLITDAEDISAIYEYRAAGNYYVTAKDLASCLGALNPDVNTDLMNSLFHVSMEDALARAQ